MADASTKHRLKAKTQNVDKESMRKFTRHLGLLIFLVAIISPFNNCGQVPNLSNTGLQLTSNAVSVQALVPPGSTAPAYKTYPNQVNIFPVTVACTSDGPATIWWSLENAGQIVLDSFSAYTGPGQNPLAVQVTSCPSSQFPIQASFNCPPSGCGGMTMHLHITPGLVNFSSQTGSISNPIILTN
jgi:hypothetical protein